MSFSKNIILNINKETVRFYMDDQNLLHYHYQEEDIILYEKKILEFDVDINKSDHIGIVILDEKGKLFYMYEKNNEWSFYLLYEVNFELEEFKYVSIKLFGDCPYILFSWHNLSSPFEWSILSYYRQDELWKKEVIHRLYLKEEIKPYILIKDIYNNLYCIYLKKQNMIYDLMLTKLSIENDDWEDPFFLCHCIFLKNFLLDALIDDKNTIHIVFTDKEKKSYCIKYISIKQNQYPSDDPQVIISNPTPFINCILLLQKNLITSYGIIDNTIYYSSKPFTNISSVWSKPSTIDTSSDDIFIIKFIKSNHSFLIPYEGNYLLSKASYDIIPIHTPSFISLNNKKPSNNLKGELYKKNNELENKTKLLQALQGNINYLKEEINRLEIQNKEYVDRIRKNSEIYQEKINQLSKEYEELSFLLEEYKKENNNLKKELEDHKNKNWIQKILG
ncbi:hypothetical protein [Anaerophilus nitritogenes]|uniref:hypothetical protein n=1 Tax=Anaerophilus nitritogenes TaxID=2498136 RepID=UPI00101BCAC5|nr:hypothetical protein [Anaerophilus nitritogenes]